MPPAWRVLLSSGDWYSYETLVEPFNVQRLLCISDRFLAHIPARPIVDLFTGLLDDAQNHNQSTTGLELPTGKAAALEGQLLAFARRQQMAMAAIGPVTGTQPVTRELKILSLGGELEKRHAEVEISLIGDKTKPARESA